MGDDVQTLRFGTLDVDFDASVLRPRPWTAAQSRWAAELAAEAPAGDLLELCTGVGHIGLLAVTLTDRRLVAVDADAHAAGLARHNARRAGLDDRVEVRLGDLEEVLGDGETFPVALADPPWVASDGVAALPEDPVHAIDGGSDGLDVARRCVTVLERHVAPGGVAVVQLGTPEQADALGRWAQERGRLVPGEVRRCEGGVLLRLDRPRTA